MKFIYQVKYTGPTKKAVGVKEYVVAAHNEDHARTMCEMSGDSRWWNINKIGAVTPDINYAVECGIITTVTC